MKKQYREWVAKRLKELREVKNVSMEDIASTAGKNVPAYKAYEQGRCFPPLPIFKLICKKLDVTMDTFMEGSPE